MGADRESPGSIDQILEALRKGRLDRRTKQARSITETKRVLEMSPHEAMKSMLRHSIAMNTLLERELVGWIVENQDNILEKDGRLPQALSGDLLKVQRSTMTAMKRLCELEGPPSLPEKEKDVSALIIECQDADN